MTFWDFQHNFEMDHLWNPLFPSRFRGHLRLWRCTQQPQCQRPLPLRKTDVWLLVPGHMIREINTKCYQSIDIPSVTKWKVPHRICKLTPMRRDSSSMQWWYPPMTWGCFVSAKTRAEMQGRSDFFGLWKITQVRLPLRDKYLGDMFVC